ncbi:myosin-9-like [Brachionichthys hirsutus]|uniref:myosin-9-like n=1 Tax=Brachionichthys hirsutus TaxID=412623 RepID=UPI0036048F1F
MSLRAIIDQLEKNQAAKHLSFSSRMDEMKRKENIQGALVEQQRAELKSVHASLKDAQKQLQVEKDRNQPEYMEVDLQLDETSTILQAEIAALRLKLRDEEQLRSTLEQNDLILSSNNMSLRATIDQLEKNQAAKHLSFSSQMDEMKRKENIQGALVEQQRAALKSVNASLKDAQKQLQVEKDRNQPEYMEVDLQLDETSTTLQAEITALRLKLRDEEQQRSTLEQNDLILSSNNMSLRATIDQLEKNQAAQNLSFSSRMDEMKRKENIQGALVEQQSAELKSVNASLKDAQKQLYETTTILQAEITALRLKLRDEEQQRSTLEQNDLILSSNNMSLRATIDQLEKNQAEKHLSFSSRMDEMKRKENIQGALVEQQRAELKSVNASLKDAQKQLYETTTILQAEITALRLKLRDEEQQRSTLEQNDLILSSNNMSLRATIDQLEKNQAEKHLSFSSRMDEMKRKENIQGALVEQQRAELKSVNASLKDAQKQLHETTTILQAEIAALRLKLRDEEQLRSTLEQKMWSLSQKNANLRDRIKPVEKRGRTIPYFISRRDEMKRFRQIHVAQLEQQRAELKSLNASLKDAQQQLESQQPQLEEDGKQKEMMQLEICTLNSQLGETSTTLQAEIAALRLKLNDEEQLRSTLEQKMLSLSQKNANQRDHVKPEKRGRTILKLKSQIVEMERNTDLHVAEIEQQKAELKRLNASLKDAQQQLESQQLQLEEDGKQKKSMRLQICTLNSQWDETSTTLQAEIAALRLKLCGEKQQRSTLEQNDLILSSNNMSLRATIDQLEKNQAEKHLSFTSRMDEMKRKENIQGALVEQQSAELKSVNASLKDVQKQLDSQQLQAEKDRKKQKEMMLVETSNMKDQLTNIQAEMSELRLKLHDEEQQRSAAEQKMWSLSQKNAHQRDRIKGVEKQWEMAILKLKSQIAEMDRNTDLHVSLLERQKAELNTQMDEMKRNTDLHVSLLERQNAELNTQMDEMERNTDLHVSLLERQKAELNTQMDEMERNTDLRVSLLEHQNAELNTQMDEMERNTDLRVSLLEHQKAELNTQMDEMERNTDLRVSLLEHQKAELNTRMDEMAKQKDQMEVSLTAALKKAEAEKDLLNETLKKKGQQCLQQMSELEYLQNHLRAKKARKKWYRIFLRGSSK